jgi:hypothetical protein
MTRSVKYLLKTFQADENLNRVTQNHDELNHRNPMLSFNSQITNWFQNMKS